MEYLMDAKESSLIRWTYAINGLINSVGIVLNVWLIIATLRNRSLHSTCFLLMAMYAVCCVFGLAKMFIPFGILLWVPVPAFPSLAICALIQLVPLAMTNNLYSLMLAISFDRLLSVFAPLWYVHRNEKRYLAILYFCSTFYPLYTIFAIIQNARIQPERQNYCTMGDALGIYAKPINFVSLLMIGLSMLCYLFVWLKLRQNLRTNPSEYWQSHHPRVFRSLLIIMSLQSFGWLVGTLGFLIGQLRFGGSPSRLVDYNVWGNLTNSFVCLCAVADTPVLYWTSSEHRKALRKEFFGLFRCFKKPTETATQIHIQSTRRVVPLGHNNYSMARTHQAASSR